MRLSRIGIFGAVLAAAATTLAAGPASADIVRTNAPIRVHVGAPYMEFPVQATTDPGDDLLSLTLTDPRYGWLADDFPQATGTPNVSKFLVTLYTNQLPSYGQKFWDFANITESGDVADLRQSVDFRAHSMAGLGTMTRRDTTVTMNGSLRVFNNVRAAYQGWTGVTIAIQRKGTGGTWTTVGTTAVDWRGNFTKTITQPHGVTLRLHVNATPTIWGADSAERWI